MLQRIGCYDKLERTGGWIYENSFSYSIRCKFANYGSVWQSWALCRAGIRRGDRHVGRLGCFVLKLSKSSNGAAR